MARLRTRLEDAYVRVVGRSALRRVNGLLFRLGARGLGMLNGGGLSGELGALRGALPPFEAPVVFDVGANKGDWSRTVLALRPRASLHLFEPIPLFAEELREALPRANVNSTAVGAAEGVATLHTYEHDPRSEHASLLREVLSRLHHAQATTTWQVPVTTLDRYCEAAGVQRIDFLKIDVEGLEYDVLLGASRLLADERIDRIQFEFNEMNTISRRFLRDFAELLPGFDLHRILPVGLLPLKSVSPWLSEQFVYQNILALRRPLAHSPGRAQAPAR